MRRALFLFVFIGWWSFGTTALLAHQTDESYIWLNPRSDRFDGRVEFRLADLRKHLDLNVPNEFEAAREEVIANSERIQEYIRKHFKIETIDGEEIPYEFIKTDLLENDFFGHFAQYYFETETLEVPSRIVVSSTLLFEFDNYSRCLLCMEFNQFTGETHPESFFHAIFSPQNPQHEIDFNDISRVRGGKKYYLWEGIRHIWIGIDHILFLVALLLASVFVKRKVDNGSERDEQGMMQPRYEWVPAEGFPGAFWNIFKIVTVFTIAHSFTLALATLDIITLPSRFVESVIALSIILVAVNNIIPTFRDRTWVILFFFGLFHGLGFASVMQNLPFRMSNLLTLLVCFNVGVEIGQLVIVAAVFPFIFMLRKWRYYKPVVLIGGSMVLIVISGYWFVQRAFGLE